MHRFYAPQFTDDREMPLSEDEARHVTRVLRLKPGDEVAIFDGQGREALARIERIAGRAVFVRVVESRQPAAESRLSLTLAQALLKSDKMDDVINDAVMLGVVAVQPFVSKRTVVPKTALRTNVRHERWQRTVIAAAKQCGRAVVPPVLDTMNFAELLTTTAGRTRVMLVEPSAGSDRSVRLQPDQPQRVTDLRNLESITPIDPLILIGPEGGWDPDEVNAAAASGVMLVTFSGATLRADAAGGVALAVLRYVWKDL